MRTVGRVTRTLAVVAISILALGLWVPDASATGNPLQPTFGTAPMSSGSQSQPVFGTYVTFTIPAQPPGQWRMKLWKMTPKMYLVGQTTGSSGTLLLPVPQTPRCTFQVDIRYAAPGSSHFTFYSGEVTTVPNCGVGGIGIRFAPKFWETHPTATAALLPQSLGHYEVSTATQAAAVFAAMNCNDIVNCLAGNMLAAKLDVSHGSSICITGMVFAARTLLEELDCAGPGAYSISPASQSYATKLNNQLASYADGSSSPSCS